MRMLHGEVECAARSSARVLLTGESGVGKEVVARLIHQRSSRREHPLVTINCVAVADSLLESELFGHVRGSFTGAYRNTRGWLAEAHRGTIFIDEIGEMSLRMQALLLRFLENGEIQPVGSGRSSVVDVRVIAATNRNLVSLITDNRFRDDLYYRLNVIHVPIPPLRERPQDIAPLFSHFFQFYGARHGGVIPVLTEDTMSRLVAYTWPGNVRELMNVAERLVIRSRSRTVTPDQLPREISGLWIAASEAGTPPIRPKPEQLFERMTVDRESFWSVVYEPFMSRDLTRDDLCAIVSRGLAVTGGNRRALAELFNLGGDYRRFQRFLNNHKSHMAFQSFRSGQVRSTSTTPAKDQVEA